MRLRRLQQWPPPQVSTLKTVFYKITIESLCPEGEVTCNNVKYYRPQQEDGEIYQSDRKTVHAVEADGITPTQFLGYRFKNENTTYFVSEDGELRITRGSNLLAEEIGVWSR